MKLVCHLWNLCSIRASSDLIPSPIEDWRPAAWTVILRKVQAMRAERGLEIPSEKSDAYFLAGCSSVGFIVMGISTAGASTKRIPTNG